MNKEKLQQVRDLIAEHGPDHFYMDNWVRRNHSDNPALEEDGKVAICGTAMCIAGWAMYAEDEGELIGRFYRSSNGDEEAEGVDPQTEAMRILDMTYGESWSLFFRTYWPAEYKEMAEFEGALKYLDDLISGACVLEVPSA